MAENSKIEWCDHTFNPWMGCTEVSPACAKCYAKALTKRYGHAGWGPHAERIRTSAANWKQPYAWQRKASSSLGDKPRVFCASLADVFENRIPEEWRSDLFKVIDDTPCLNWLLLTKRPQLVAKMLPPDWGQPHGDEWFAGENVWLGTTVENQEEAERRIPHLTAIPAVVRFLSAEPLLGAIQPDLTGIDWVICGGESGPGRRPMDPGWARALRDQCAASGVAFFMKQMDKVQPIPDDLMIRQFPVPRYDRFAAPPAPAAIAA
jgi:protein gp37